MRINNNITAINSHRQYGINNNNIGKNVEKLSSGFRVNRAGDDAAGLAISEKMRAQIRGLNMASKNSQDAISLVQVAEGGMQTIQNILQRGRELAVQSASDTNATLDRESLQKELDQLIDEINQIADTTEFNTMKLLDGSFGKFVSGSPTQPKVIQAGANAGQEMNISIAQVSSAGIGTMTSGVPNTGMSVADLRTNASTGNTAPSVPDKTVSPDNAAYVVANSTVNGGIMTQSTAAAAITVLNNAINVISEHRADLGAIQNRLEYKIQNLDNAAENMQAAESRIRDADMAKMMTEFTKNNILFQASTAMLAQANALPQGVLRLLG